MALIGTSAAIALTTNTLRPIGGAVSPMPTTISTRMPNQIATSSGNIPKSSADTIGKNSGRVSRIMASSSMTAPSRM